MRLTLVGSQLVLVPFLSFSQFLAIQFNLSQELTFLVFLAVSALFLGRN